MRCGAGEGDAGARELHTKRQGQLWGQLAAASGEGTKWHLPNIAPATHLPAGHCGHPKHAFPSRLPLIQAAPLPSDLPLLQGEYHRAPTQIPCRAHPPPQGKASWQLCSA